MTDTTHIKIKDVTPRVQYIANGVTTEFPYEFPIFDEINMQVYLNDELIDPDGVVVIGEDEEAVEYPIYVVDGVGEDDGGNVTFTIAPENGTLITLVRNVPIERVTDFQEGGTFRPKNLNDDFDRQTAFCQQIQESLSRCVKVGVTSQSDPSEILPLVESLYDDLDNIDTVADNINDVGTVADGIGDIGTCADNMPAIQDAPTQATNAANSASDAAASAASAAQSAAAAMPPPLLSFMWSDHLINQISWLRADTFSWQSGDVYTAAYNHLVDDLSTATQKTDGLVEWTQPVLTSNNTSTDLGTVVVTCSGNYSGYDAWKAMDGVKSGTDSATGWGTNNSNSGWWQVKFPYKLLITGLKGYQRYDVTPANANTVGRFYTSSTKETPIGDEYSNATSTNWSEVEVTGIPSEGIVTDTIYFEKTSATYGGFGELEITARRLTSDHPITYYEAEDGHKIVLPDQASIAQDIYDETGVAWYYILDTTNQRFKLPRTKYGFTGLRDAVGKYVPETLPNIVGTSQTAPGRDGYSSTGAFSKYETPNATGVYANGSTGTRTQYGIEFNASRVSSTYQDSAPVQQRATQMYLYFYVGQYAQSAVEQTAGLNTELFNEKMDSDAVNATSATVNTLIGKADSTTKQTIVRWCCPDSSRVVSLGGAGSYTAPGDGWISGISTSTNRVLIENTTSHLYNGGSHNTTTTEMASVSCTTGDSITVTSNGSCTVYFVPMIGG